MTKDDFKKMYFSEIGTDTLSPSAHYSVCTNKIIKNMDLDKFTLDSLRALNEETIKTFQTLENAIFNLCD